MKKFGQIMLIGFGFAVLSAVLSPNLSKTARADHTSPVLVTNTTAQPVPTSAAQSGTWSVGIAGTPTVNIGNTPTVTLGSGSTVGVNGSIQVGNTATSPVPVSDVDNPAKHPFQTQICFSFQFACPPATVPSGKELVIEYIAGACSADATGFVDDIFLGTTAGGSQASYTINMPPVKASTTSTFSQQMRIYADPGTQVGINGTFGGTGTSCSLAISGSLVSVP